MKNIQLEKQLKTHHDSAYLWTLQCCGQDREMASDVLQEVYLKILEGKARFSGKSSFKSWLFSVVRFTAIDTWRKKRHFEELDEIDISLEMPTGATDNYRQLLGQLPGRQHQVLLLYFYHDLTLEDVAEVLGLHVGTVRTHYSRGKEALRKLIIKENA